MWQQAVVYAQDATGSGSASPGGGLSGTLLFMLVFFAIFWFLLIRPNQRRERDRRDMLARLRKGDEVITTGGICGTIVGLNDKTVVLKVSDEPVLKMKFVRGAVQQAVTVESAAEEDADGKS